MKKIKTYLLILAIILLVLSSILMLIPLKYESKIEKYLVEQLNQSLTVPMKIQSIDLNLFYRFPKASVIVKGIQMQPPGDNVEFVECEKFYIILNLMDLFLNHYRIERIEVSHMQMNLLHRSNGSYNYNIFKSSSSSGKDYSWDIDRIIIRQAGFAYIDEKENWSLHSHIDKLICSGKTDTNLMDFHFSIKAITDSILVNNSSVWTKQEVKASGQWQYDMNKDQFGLSSHNLTLLPIQSADLKLDVFPDYFQLEMENVRMDIRKMMEKLKENNYPLAEKISAEGNGMGNIIIHDRKGPVSMQAGFNTNNLALFDSSFSLHGITLSSVLTATDLTDLRSYFLDAHSLAWKDKSSSIAGTIKIRDFMDLNTLANFRGEIPCELLSWVISDSLMSLKGENINSRIHINGKLTGWFPGNKSTLPETEAVFQFSDNVLTVPDLNSTMHLKGKLQFHSNEAKFYHFQLYNDDLNATLQGQIEGIFDYIRHKREKLNFHLEIASGRLDMDHLLSSSSNQNDSSHEFYLPSWFTGQMKFRIDTLIYDKNKYTALAFQAQSSGNGLKINSLRVHAFEGDINSELLLSEWEDGYDISGSVDLNDIDIKELFRSTHNFGQDYLKSEHLAGKARAHIELIYHTDKKFKPDLDRLFVIGDMEIQKGELNNFEPMERLFGFIKARQLKNIRFATLANTILIKDRTVFIPTMFIQSNVTQLTMQGEHHFDNQIDYHFKVNLTSLFFKTYKNFSVNTQDEKDGKGGINLYIRMHGSSDNPQISYDRREVKQNLIRNFENEKKEIKKILQKKDKKQAIEEYELEWDDG